MRCVFRVCINSVLQAHLIAMHHEVVCGDQGFENHHPAGISGPLHQRVGHLGDVHIGLLGGLDQVWEAVGIGGTAGQILAEETQGQSVLKAFYSSNGNINHCRDGVRQMGERWQTRVW